MSHFQNGSTSLTRHFILMRDWLLPNNAMRGDKLMKVVTNVSISMISPDIFSPVIVVIFYQGLKFL